MSHERVVFNPENKEASPSSRHDYIKASVVLPEGLVEQPHEFLSLTSFPIVVEHSFIFSFPNGLHKGLY